MKKELVPFGMGLFVGFILLSMYFGKIQWDIEASVIVAICALALAVWQGVLTRQHNRLSVQPEISTYNKVSKTDILYQFTNKGLGTAYCTKFEYLLSGEVVTEEKYFLILRKLYHKHNLDPEKCALTRFIVPMSIAKDETIEIIKASIHEQASSTKFWYDYAVEFRIKVYYQCIYGIKRDILI